MSKLDKEKVLAEYTEAYEKAHGKKPKIEASNGWYSVDGGKNVRLAQLDEEAKALAKGKPAKAEKASDKKAAPKKASAKKTETKSDTKKAAPKKTAAKKCGSRSWKTKAPTVVYRAALLNFCCSETQKATLLQCRFFNTLLIANAITRRGFYPLRDQ